MLERLESEETDGSREVHPLRVYGVSGGTIKKEIKVITGINPENDAVYTKETGRVSVTPEIYITTGGCTDFGGGGGGGEGALFCIILIIAMFAVFAIVWAVVMIAFSIMTFGGFVRKRYRTLVLLEKENTEFIGKLSIMIFRKGGVLMHPLGHPDYDGWVADTFRMFNRLKLIRQLSLVLGFLWGFIEVAFKLYQIILAPTFNYNLWPLRFVMIAIFVPLLLFSPILGFQLRDAFDMGEEIVMGLVSREPFFSPDRPMAFEEKPRGVAKISTSEVKLK